MGQAHADRPHAEALGAIPCSIMKNDMWFTVWGGHYLNLSPTQTTNAGTKHLRHGLLRRKTSSKAVHAAGTERDLRWGEDALEELITSDFDGALKLLKLDSINAGPNDG